MTRSVRVLLFATAREAVGAASVDWEVPASGSTVRALLAGLVEEHPQLEPILKGSRLACNGVYVRGRRARIGPGDEIAIHPPYSGG
ncbi:MAG: MoaD/ThiS family protein [Thermoplasmata archaeon]|nr:MoaD/ThiS family protein [Thermoplasmata archaeon]